MAIVCCNLLLGYTLLKTDAAATDEVVIQVGSATELNTLYTNDSIDSTKTYRIKLTANISSMQVTVPAFVVKSNLIFDLNGHTWTPAVSEYSDYNAIFYMMKAYSLEITDSSTAQSGQLNIDCPANKIGLGVGLSLVLGEVYGSSFVSNVKISGGTIKFVYSSSGNVIFRGRRDSDTTRTMSSVTVTMTGGKVYCGNTSTLNTAQTVLRCCGGELYYNNVLQSKVHSYGSGVVTKEATCTATGVKTYTCTVCGSTKTEIIPALEHSYTKIVVTAPTCTAQGYTTHTCSRCGDSYQDTYTAATGHTWGEWVVDTEPTPDHAGSHYHECTTCYETEREDITLTLEKITVSSKQESYAVGDEADLMVAGIYTRSDTGAEVSYELTAEQYSVIPNDLTLSLGENILTILYNGETATKTATIKIFVAEPEEPEQPDDGDNGEEGETPDDGEVETPTTPDNQPTPDAPRAETPNNTPWIMLFVGIGVGAVLLVGGITLGVVLSKRKSK